MKRVHKYRVDRSTEEFQKTGRFSILGPRVEKVLCVGRQGSEVYVWLLVDPNSTEQTATELKIVGTGQNIDEGTYIQTFFDGPFVWHLFQV